MLFDRLYTVFRLLPSNSRLCEQVQPVMLRHSFKSEIRMDQADLQYSYVVNHKYYLREEWREHNNKKQKLTVVVEQPKEGNIIEQNCKHK